MPTDRYQVNTRVELIRLDPDGRCTGDRLSFEDRAELGALTFLQISHLLVKFHEIGQGFAANTAPS